MGPQQDGQHEMGRGDSACKRRGHLMAAAQGKELDYSHMRALTDHIQEGETHADRK